MSEARKQQQQHSFEQRECAERLQQHRAQLQSRELQAREAKTALDQAGGHPSTRLRNPLGITLAESRVKCGHCACTQAEAVIVKMYVQLGFPDDAAAAQAAQIDIEKVDAMFRAEAYASHAAGFRVGLLTVCIARSFATVFVLCLGIPSAVHYHQLLRPAG